MRLNQVAPTYERNEAGRSSGAGDGALHVHKRGASLQFGTWDLRGLAGRLLWTAPFGKVFVRIHTSVSAEKPNWWRAGFPSAKATASLALSVLALPCFGAPDLQGRAMRPCPTVASFSALPNTTSDDCSGEDPVPIEMLPRLSNIGIRLCVGRLGSPEAGSASRRRRQSY